MRKPRLWALAVVTTLVFAACTDTPAEETSTTESPGTTTGDTTTETTTTPTTEPPEAPGPSGVVTLGGQADIEVLDPHFARFGPDFVFLEPVYDTLLRITWDREIVGHLATDWEFVDGDPTQLRLNLRDDVTFVDGEAFNADVVRLNLERARDAEESQVGAAMVTLDSVEVVDDTTVILHLTEPNPQLLLHLSDLPGMMISPAAVDNEDLDTNPVGSGPYLLNAGETTFGSRYVYEVNPDYWDPSLQRLEGVELQVITDDDARLSALLAGQIDFARGVIPQWDEAEAAGVTVQPQVIIYEGLMLSDRDGEVLPPLADVRVRQALNYAVDRDAIVEAVKGGHAIKSTQQYNPTASSAADPALNERYPYDPEMALQLLEEAGFGDGFSFEITTSPTRLSVAEALAGFLADIGVEMSINVVDGPLSPYLTDPEVPVAAMAFGTVDPAPMSLNYHLPDSPFNRAEVNPEIVELYDAAIHETDLEAQNALFAELMAMVTEEAWYVITHLEETPYFYGPRVAETAHSWFGPALGVPPIYEWRLSDG